MRPVLTSREELLRLMANEFHEVGLEAFVPNQAAAYIRRLTAKQLALLNDDGKTPDGELTAFITFGDGFFDRYIPADFCARSAGDDVRPNASLALFYRSGEERELVFYTRFFVVSYFPLRSQVAAGLGRIKSLQHQFREATGDPDADLDFEETNAAIGIGQEKRSIFDVMLGLRHLRRKVGGLDGSRRDFFEPVEHVGDDDDIDPIAPLQLRINSPSGEGSLGFGIPYITLSNLQGRSVMPGAWIHGFTNTKGCWMMLRNYEWRWPDENLGFSPPTGKGLEKPVFERFAEIYLAARRKGSDRAIRAYLDAAFDAQFGWAPPDPEDFGVSGVEVPNWRLAFSFASGNWSYFDFLNMFAGAPFVSPPARVKAEHVPCAIRRNLRGWNVRSGKVTGDPGDTATAFVTDLPGLDAPAWNGAVLEFMDSSPQGLANEGEQAVALYDPQSKRIEIVSPLPRVPREGERFFIWREDRSFLPLRANVPWVPNVFGHTFALRQPWCNVYLFKARNDRTGSFTPDDGAGSFVNP